MDPKDYEKVKSGSSDMTLARLRLQNALDSLIFVTGETALSVEIRDVVYLLDAAHAEIAEAILNYVAAKE